MMTSQHVFTNTGSIAVVDKKLIESFVSNCEFPFLVSFERTGSHWLRMLMELYFEKPSLVRIFYFREAEHFTCCHRHDEDLSIQRKNIIYLYRFPVDTIYSVLSHFGEDVEDIAKIISRSHSYARHLNKWLIEETFTSKKLIITYEGMESDISNEFMRICRFFSVPFEQNKLLIALNRVTTIEVKNKTTHDPRVINMTNKYKMNKIKFRQKHGDLVMDCIYSSNPSLEDYFRGK